MARNTRARTQARPSRRRYRSYQADSLVGSIETVARPGLEAIARPRVLTGFLLVVVIGLAIWMGADDQFYISGLRVTGNLRTPSLDIALKSGIVGLHIFWFNASETEVQLPKLLPSIKRARVTCDFPAKCTISVQERMPLVAWQYGGVTTWIDADRIAFAAQGSNPPDSLITIVAPQGPALFPGQQADPQLVDAALAVAQALPEVHRYRYTKTFGLEFDDPRGFPVYLGLNQNMADRISIWKALSAELAARNIQPRFVDVRFPLAPYYGE